MADNPDWNELPEHVLESVFTYLNLKDKYHAALVCQFWSRIFNFRSLWRHFMCQFNVPRHKRFLKFFELHGDCMESLHIQLDQSEKHNRDHACRALQLVSQQKVRRLRKLKVQFTGDNPYFYSGQEFVDALIELFGPPSPDVEMMNTLEVVDLKDLFVAYDDRIINLLSANHPTLRKLDLQNLQLVCKISPSCMLQLVQKCRSLQDLRIYKCSLSADILKAFTEDSRAPLNHLSTISRTEERLVHSIPAEIWQAVVTKLPKLKITLKFDNTCLLEKVVDVMKYEVPVTELWLETYMLLHEEVVQCCRHYVENLEKFVLTTPLTKPSAEFEQALLSLTNVCPKLDTLYVYTVLKVETIQGILEKHPHMKEKKTYILNSTPEPHPWEPLSNKWP